MSAFCHHLSSSLNIVLAFDVFRIIEVRSAKNAGILYTYLLTLYYFMRSTLVHVIVHSKELRNINIVFNNDILIPL